MIFEEIKEINYDSADVLWDALSPTRNMVQQPCKLIYRGQADAAWGLIPSVLRRETFNPASILLSKEVNADDQVFIEIRLLELFSEFCDKVGTMLPNDSLKFRTKTLSTHNQDRYYRQPQLWPNKDLLEVMALAQHHGVPTRLLDWTELPYVAVYFAASSALARSSEWNDKTRLALWVLDIESISLYPNVKIVKVPGSITPHISAQSGLFTVHPHNGLRGCSFEVNGLEREFGILPNTPLMKLTIPVKESLRLYELCTKSGISGAFIYPSADGAGKAVMDSINAWTIDKHYNK